MARLGRRNNREEVDTELNMVPIMNMFMVLIPFLLMSAAFYHIKAVNTSIPVHGNKSADEQAAPAKEEIKVTMVLELKPDRVVVSALSDQLAASDLGTLETTMQRHAGEDFSVAQIAEFLKRVKARYPASDTLLLIPDGSISYNEIIQAMDCARNSESDVLFPHVVLSGSLG